MILQEGDRVKVKGTSITGTVQALRAERDNAHGSVNKIVTVTVKHDNSDIIQTYVINELRKHE